MTSVMPKRWTVSSEAGKAAGVPLALFIALAANAWHRKSPNDIDRLLYDKLGADGHGVVFSVSRVLSVVLSPAGGAVLTVVASAWVWRRRRDVVSAFVLFAATGLSAVVQLLAKPIVRRLRPPTMGLTGESGFGFPSGHASGFGALATVVALLILAKRFPTHRPARAVPAALIFGFLAASDRLFVGAHYFTDVLGGLALGSGIACLLIALLPFFDSIYEHMSGRLPTWLRPATS
jgi:membrane-associated phospholipid phosphatase